ncbi:hypothetical protein FRC04_008453 [Tulasnella sp. 424]|nr:hypothetical protein FRC04_008453 [Tulasnella sp. 424]KAG8973935.1 hypothetical protein FRC05_007992 [Tulasnella sp. 425]
MATPSTTPNLGSHYHKPGRRGGSAQFAQVAADFTKPTTRSRVSGNDADDLQDEMNSFDTIEHPLFDALQRDNAHIVQQRIFTPWKKTLFRLFESPTSSSSAFIIHVTSTALIVFSAFITILETLPAFHATPSYVWFGIETSLVVLFTVEYIGRLLAHSESWSELLGWAGSFFAIIDLLAILPYYIMIMIRADTTTFFRFSILRTFRLLRVFRPFRYSNTILLTIEVMYIAVVRSREALFALAFFVGMALVVFSTLLYFAERGTWDDTLGTFVNSDGDPSQFESIPAAAWFVLVTITTVGYGEIIPRSFLGRLIAVPLLMFGLILIALPSFVLGREFSVVWEGMGGTSMLRMTANGRGPRNRETDQEAASASTLEPSQVTPILSSPRSAQLDGDVIFSSEGNSRNAQSSNSYPPQRSSRTAPIAMSRAPRTRPNDEIDETPEFGNIGAFPQITGPYRRRRAASDAASDRTGISNLKLAENQQMLSAQLEQLMQIVENIREDIRGMNGGPRA